jgi:hypothetical protein
VFANGFSMPGGTADASNVELIVVENPTPGDWIISIIGTVVNNGRPGQGYALVASADLAVPPSPTS